MKFFKIPDPADPVTDDVKGAVLVIGNCDGVHRGHQALLSLARQKAASMGRPFGLVTFEPHPRQFFNNATEPFRITPIAVKRNLLNSFGIDVAFEVDFTMELANMSAADFIDKILHAQIGAHTVIMGQDFKFGYRRAGSIADFAGTPVHAVAVEPVCDNAGIPYSSTRVRDAIRNADLETARDLLGWTWLIEGKVVHGDKRGREFGYPTANVPLENTIHPSYGVYAARVEFRDGRSLPAAVNIGIRPMFETKIVMAEAHILDFDEDIYGRDIRIVPVEKIRNEAKYDSVEALIAQIGRDCDKCRAILTRKTDHP